MLLHADVDEKSISKKKKKLTVYLNNYCRLK